MSENNKSQSETLADVISLSESQAVHECLLNYGFVFDRERRIYFFHDFDGTVLFLIKHTESASFDRAIRQMGSYLFNHFNPRAVQKAARSIQNGLIAACAVWEDQYSQTMERVIQSF